MKSKVLSGGNITGVVLDAEVPIVNEPDGAVRAGMLAVAVDDWLARHYRTGIKIRRRRLDGDVGPPASIHCSTALAAPSGTVTFATSVPDDAAIVADCLAWTGPLASEERRMIVTNIEPRPEHVRHADHGRRGAGNSSTSGLHPSTADHIGDMSSRRA